MVGRYDKYNHEDEEVVVVCRGATYRTINKYVPKSWITGNAMIVTSKESSKLNKDFLFNLLHNSDLTSTISGSAQPQIARQDTSPVIPPLPPIAVQKEIVSKIKVEKTLIESKRKLIECFKRKIKNSIDNIWSFSN